ncbi:MAG: hypothetical protein MZV70_53285 [Desulfobacterales bacterium]|nr:hypothetical protein [Desulfobacterales bacterium]
MKALYFDGENGETIRDRRDPRAPARAGPSQARGAARRGLHVLRRADGGDPRGTARSRTI